MGTISGDAKDLVYTTAHCATPTIFDTLQELELDPRRQELLKLTNILEAQHRLNEPGVLTTHPRLDQHCSMYYRRHHVL